VTQIIAQLPPVIESLTGIKLEKLIERIPALSKLTPPADSGEKK
jgi:flotillin